MSSQEISRLKDRRETLVNYLMSCFRAEDWHGVCDAANDIRVTEAKLEIYGVKAETLHPDYNRRDSGDSSGAY